MIKHYQEVRDLTKPLEIKKLNDQLRELWTKVKSIDGKDIRKEAIEERHIQSEAITSDKIKANSITAEHLSIEYAEIEHLNAALVRITTLEATRATIEQLDVLKANINTLNASKASIQDLESTNADITNLTANVATIDTLINGNLTSANMQAGAIQAGDVVIADGAISDAMIQNLSVNKILAGDISTNKFRIVSDSGNMLMSDNTIQISDDNIPRVQIGKDASDDYSMYVWDAQGNLMFDATGLKEDGIKDNIIRDDMVSDNANIDAKKLDINSLFTEINDSSQTIKSNKILLDTEAQTLDLAFSNLKTSVDDNIQTTNSHGTRISVVEGNISNKIWQTDIQTSLDTAKAYTETKANEAESGANNYTDSKVTVINNNHSALTQTVNSINQTVGSHSSTITDLGNDLSSIETRVQSAEQEVTKDKIISKVSDTFSTKTEVNEAVNEIEVGGRNLVLLSDKFNVGSYATGIASSITDEGYLQVISQSGNGNFHTGWYKSLVGIEDNFVEGDVFTISFTIKRISGTGTPTIYIKNGMGYYSLIGNLNSDFSKLYYCGTWKKLNGIVPHLGWSGTVGTFVIKNWKLEKGNKATDWTPAPEDTQDQIDNVSQRVSSAEQKILPEAITSTVRSSTEYIDDLGEKVNTNEVISSINQSPEEIQVNANRVKIGAGTTFEQGVIYTWEQYKGKTWNEVVSL